MPLANEIPRVSVDCEGFLPDGTPYTDTYWLKGALGYHDTNNILLAGMTVNDLKYFNRESKNGSDVIEDKGVLSAGDFMNRRDFLILRTWLVDWSHKAPLNDDNIREIPPAHVKEILKTVEGIGRDANKKPFPGDTGDEGLSGDDRPGGGDKQSDHLHPKGTGVAGQELDDSLPGYGQAISIPDG